MSSKNTFYTDAGFPIENTARGVEEKLDYINRTLEEEPDPEEVEELNRFYAEAVEVLEDLEDEVLDGPYVRSSGKDNSQTGISISVSFDEETAKGEDELSNIEETVLYAGELAREYTEELNRSIGNGEAPSSLGLNEEVARPKPEKVRVEDYEPED